MCGTCDESPGEKKSPTPCRMRQGYQKNASQPQPLRLLKSRSCLYRLMTGADVQWLLSLYRRNPGVLVIFGTLVIWSLTFFEVAVKVSKLTEVEYNGELFACGSQWQLLETDGRLRSSRKAIAAYADVSQTACQPFLIHNTFSTPLLQPADPWLEQLQDRFDRPCLPLSNSGRWVAKKRG